MQRFSVALIVVVLAVAAAPNPAGAQLGVAASARWTRTLGSALDGGRGGNVFVLLDDGNVLVRSGRGVAAIDAHSGATRWSLPAVAGASVTKTSVVLRRSNVVFAVRARDGGMLWKYPCADPPYVIGVGERILTMCAGRSTVLDRHDGHVLVQRTIALRTSPVTIRGARALNDRFALVDNFFDGAWMGDEYSIVDSRSGEFVWSETDLRVLHVTATTIAITPYPSMLPWAGTGTVVRRRLADGATVERYTYQLPVGSDGEGRGNVSISRAAAYVSTNGGPLFRFRLKDRVTPVRLFDDGAEVADVLGSAAFVSVGTNAEHELFLDRPSSQGGFVTRRLGRFRDPIAAGGDETHYGAATRVGDRVAAAGAGLVTLYDEFGDAGIAAQNPCTGLRRVLDSHATLFVLCEAASPSAPTLSAYSFP